MEPDPQTLRDSSTGSLKSVILSPVDSKMEKDPGHDSMVTVRLSEPPSLTVNTDLPPTILPTRKSIFGPECTPKSVVANETPVSPARESMISPKTTTSQSLQDELREVEDGDSEADKATPTEPEAADESSSDDEEVNWEQLQKTEDEQAKAQDDNSTAMLLARLEQENNKLATNPKTVKVKVVEQLATRRPRPPSMAQLKDMVNAPTPTALRYSVVPPPPMTDLEFYMALVKDYQQTAARLPTLLSNKIRKGIPPPLRGVVWQSMAGARDSMLLDQYEKLNGESSPYEGLIGKDLGRSFPGVDMFREQDGEGQRMLGRVLKCFSLYDQKIGYCQGLAFLVGPLLMHMPDNQAFCVLVRLMEHYDLRSCFLPDLSGLHVRIYQFRELLRQNLTAVANHLDHLQVDPAYVSQWFLSFFATTCPLPMLFRIYDVIFAEGSSETIMRVALSLMRKNENRILACTELEDVMHLLLSRGLWDCYHYNADEFVDDFVSLSGVVSREKLAQLDQSYREEKIATSNAARASDISTAASRFLGRLWTQPRSAALSPGLVAPSRPLSMLRRSTSKQSLASTLNSVEASSTSIHSSASTEATTASRDSSNADDVSIREVTPVASKQQAASKANDRNLHTQIEDLLTALSELQRSHALIATDLQREREERDEDRKAVNSLLAGLKKKSKADGVSPGESDEQADAIPEGNEASCCDPQTPTEEQMSALMESVEDRFTPQKAEHKRKSSSSLQTKAQLKEELDRTKEHLRIEMSKHQEFQRQLGEMGQEASSLREHVRESQTRIRNLHTDKQRLEKQVQTLRQRSHSAETPASTSADPTGWFTSSANLSASPPSRNSGLRELKLSRSKSTPSTQPPLSSQSSSLARTQTEPLSPGNDHEALVLELVQAKTAEAVARQEADEYKQKLEGLRKAYGLAPGDTAGSAASAAMGVFGRLTSSISEANNAGGASRPTTPGNTANTGGFWGWRR